MGKVLLATPGRPSVHIRIDRPFILPTPEPATPTEGGTMPGSVPPELLSSEQAAPLVGVKPRTLESWRSRGYGPPFIRISRRAIRYRREDLERWVNARRIGAMP